MDPLQALTSIFGAFALLALMLSGLVMMFSPEMGRQLFKNTLVALALFVIGSMLLHASCGSSFCSR